MGIDIITGYPSWYLILCIFAGILASLFLYYKDSKNEFPVWLKRLLGVVRFFIVALLAFLLLSPLLKKTSRYSEKPIIIIAQDNSLSIKLNKDSLYYLNEYTGQLNHLVGQFDESYEVRLFTYGENVRSVDQDRFDTLYFDEKQTDISALFEMADVRFANRNVGAFIICGDGIFNKGLNPAYQYTNLAFPVYTIASGDTAVRRDVWFKRVLYNKIAFQGNDFPVEVILNANKLEGKTISLSVSEGGTSILSKQIPVTGNNFSETLRLNITAGDPGTHHYVLKINSSQGEITYSNNRYDLFIDVLKSRQKVLILANAPHPDISALKEAISNNLNYEVEDYMLREFAAPLNDYSLVVLHQLPSDNQASAAMVNRIQREGIPVLYIVGKQTNLTAFNSSGTGLSITPYNRNGINEAIPALNEAFSLFSIGDDMKELIPFLPPLVAPFARYNTMDASGILFYQKIGNVNANDPLWMLLNRRDSRNGVIVGTGIWKWRMKSWQESGSHKVFDELINKSIQYLAVKEDKRRFRVTASENIPENHAVEIKAELYNESYESINDPEVELLIMDETGNAYDFIFSRADGRYYLNAGAFPVGTYTYRASVSLGSDVHVDEGGFTIIPVVAEKVALRAAHGLMQRIAEDNGGRMFSIREMDSIPAYLSERGDIKPIVHSERKYIEFIDIWWLLVILMGLLGLEWFLRKWSGSY